VVERRLRTFEAEVAGAPPRQDFQGEFADAGKKGTGWFPVEGRDTRFDRGSCQGCGGPIEIDEAAAIVACPSCGSRSKVERRLRNAASDAVVETPRPRHPSEIHRTEGHDQDPETEHLIYRLVTAKDPRTRLVLARRFETWDHVNATAARLLPSLLSVMRESDPALAWAIGDLVGKLLCEGKKELRNTTIRAAERFVFDPQCPRALVVALSLGSGVVVKLLLDAADVAARRGATEAACAALLGVNQVFERNYPDHEAMGEIILYRMLYLSGPILAWALRLARRQGGIGFYYKFPVLLRFLEDCEAERPELVPEIQKCFYLGPAKTLAELDERIALFRSLRGRAARESALRELFYPPEEGEEAFAERVLPVLVAALGEPDLAAAADHAISHLMHYTFVPAAVHALVKERGESLPGLTRWAYLRAVDTSPLLSRKNLPPQVAPAPEVVAPEVARSAREWAVGLDAALARNVAERDLAYATWRSVRPGEGEIFAPGTEGPPPVPARPAPPSPQANAAARVQLAHLAYARALQENMTVMATLIGAGKAPGMPEFDLAVAASTAKLTAAMDALEAAGREAKEA
jgi:predicted RNA-binding Zn-ribbon protein involved in translation (DUF1610 family)